MNVPYNNEDRLKNFPKTTEKRAVEPYNTQENHNALNERRALLTTANLQGFETYVIQVFFSANNANRAILVAAFPWLQMVPPINKAPRGPQWSQNTKNA